MTLIEHSHADEFAPIEPILWPAIWRHRRMIVALALAAGLGAFVLSSLQEDTFVARVEVLLANPASAGSIEVGGPRGARYDTSQANLADSTTVAGIAGMAIDESPADLASAVTVSVLDSGSGFAIKASRPTGAEAAAYANAVAAAYEELRVAQATEAAAELVAVLEANVAAGRAAVTTATSENASEVEITTLASELARQEDQLRQVELDLVRFGSGVLFVDEAVVPSSRTSPDPLRDSVLGLGLGLALAVGFAFWRQARLPLAADHLDAAMVLDAPMLAEVPEFGPADGVPHLADAETAATTFGLALSALGVMLNDGEPKLIVVTSPHSGDGRTVTAINLAAAAATDGHQTLLVDADLRARRVTALAGVDDAAGLCDLGALGSPDPTELIRTARVDQADIRVLAAGTPPHDPSAFLRNRAFLDIMESLRGTAEVTFIDTPPLLISADAVSVAAHADGAIMVVDRGTPLSSLKTGRERLSLVGVPLLGYVYNRSSGALFSRNRRK